MDLYLVSPVFLKRMMVHRPSGASPLEDERAFDSAPPTRPPRLQRDEDEDEEKLLLLWQRRRRSSLDRMLRQHAYIIIWVLCYACALARPSS